MNPNPGKQEGRSEIKSRGFQDLEMWQLAHRWVLEIYKLTEAFPKQELFGLTSQLRRAAVSVPANIAEGYRKKGNGRQSQILQHIARIAGRMSLLFNPYA